MSEANVSSVRLSKIIAQPFFDVHKDLRSGLHSEYWLKGGRGSTKSSFISLEIITGLIRDTDANAIIYRRVGNTIKDSVYEQMIWAIDKLNLNEFFKLKVSPMEIIYKPTGQKILFRGADDPLKSKSIKLSKGYFKYLWFEELSEFRSMEDIRTIQQSVLRGGKKAFTLYSYNPPKSAQSWVNGESIKAVDMRYVHHSSYLDVPEDWLGESFLSIAEGLKKTNELAYRNEYLGDVTGVGGNVFENVVVRKVEQAEIDSLQWFYQGIDWGWFPDPFQWVQCGWEPKKRKLYILDEFRANKMSNFDAYNAIKDKLSSTQELTADSAEQKSVADFKTFGAWWIKGAVKGPGSVDYSMKWLASLSEIIIDEKCKEAAKEFLAYEYERNAQGEFVNGYVDERNHCLTAETLVDTVDGQKRIVDLVGKSGLVNAYDEGTGEPVVKPFMDVRMTGIEEIYEIELDDGNVLKCSAEHPIMTRRGWVEAKDLTDVDEILKINF